MSGDIILLPDAWTLPEDLSFTAGISGGYANNVYTATQWAQMEANGALFLHAAGYRSGIAINSPNFYGNYWSSSYTSQNLDYAWGLFSFSGSLIPTYGFDHRWALPVRLVRNVE